MEKYAKRFTKQEKSWILYDWANSVYATNIMAAILERYANPPAWTMSRFGATAPRRQPWW